MAVKRGRPVMAKGKSKASTLIVRVKPALHKKIVEAAKADGADLSEWIRSALLVEAIRAIERKSKS